MMECNYNELERIIIDRLSDNTIKSKLNDCLSSETDMNDIYVFAAIATDNTIDRDGEAFNKEALDRMSELYIGRSGIYNHNSDSSHFRIFDTEVFECNDHIAYEYESYKCLVTYCYTNDSGLKKDIIDGIVSGCSISANCNKVCSICGARIDSNDICENKHICGEMYDNKLCFRVLSNVSDVYELSIVSIPCNINARIIRKDYKNMKITKALEEHESGGNAMEDVKKTTKNKVVKVKKSDDTEEMTDTSTENVTFDSETSEDVDKLNSRISELENLVNELRDKLAESEGRADSEMKSYSVKRYIKELNPVNDRAEQMALDSIDMDKVVFDSSYNITDGLDDQLENVGFLFSNKSKKEKETDDISSCSSKSFGVFSSGRVSEKKVNSDKVKRTVTIK